MSSHLCNESQVEGVELLWLSQHLRMVCGQTADVLQTVTLHIPATAQPRPSNKHDQNQLNESSIAYPGLLHLCAKLCLRRLYMCMQIF